MYTLTTLQAPRGHMTRPQTYCIGHKVNSLLFEPSLSTYETWYYLMHGPCIYSGTTETTMEDPRTKAKHGRGEGRRSRNKLLESPELPASARNFRPPDLPACPEHPVPRVQASPERANSMDSPEPGRNLPRTSGARNRPHPKLPSLPARKDSGQGPMYPPSHLPLVG